MADVSYARYSSAARSSAAMMGSRGTGWQGWQAEAPAPLCRRGPGTEDPGRITAARATLANLLTRAYDVRYDQISGPLWLNDGSYAYAIDATIPPNTTKDQFRLMLQNLLAERFHLKLHHQAQARSGYELTVAPGGPKLKPWKPSAKPGPPAAPVSIMMNTSGRPYRS